MATGHSFQALALSDKGIDQDEIVSGESTKDTTGIWAYTLVCVYIGGRESTNPDLAAQSITLHCVKITQVYMKALLLNRWLSKVTNPCKKDI